MKIAGSKICPSCGHSNPATATLCNECGKEISARKYEIILDPDGWKFAIRFKDKITVHGLDIDKARELASILNSIRDGEVA